MVEGWKFGIKGWKDGQETFWGREKGWILGGEGIGFPGAESSRCGGSVFSAIEDPEEIASGRLYVGLSASRLRRDRLRNDGGGRPICPVLCDD